jgi:hypothetical protein
MVFFIFYNLRWELVVCFVDICRVCWPLLIKLSFHKHLKFE